MPEPPDFDRIARGLIEPLVAPIETSSLAALDGAERQAEIDAAAYRAEKRSDEQIRATADCLRQLWNARGVADAQAVEERLAILTGWVTSDPYRHQFREAIVALDVTPVTKA